MEGSSLVHVEPLNLGFAPHYRVTTFRFLTVLLRMSITVLLPLSKCRNDSFSPGPIVRDASYIPPEN